MSFSKKHTDITNTPDSRNCAGKVSAHTLKNHADNVHPHISENHAVNTNVHTSKNRTRRIATVGVLTAGAFILSWLEAMLPALTPVPGIKIGLANIVVLVTLYCIGIKEAVFLALVRILLSGFSFSGIFAMSYSLAGAAISILVMILLMKTKSFSTLAISIAGGVLHNLGQITVAYFVTGRAILYYTPFLIIGGAVAGTITGLISSLIKKTKIISAGTL